MRVSRETGGFSGGFLKPVVIDATNWCQVCEPTIGMDDDAVAAASLAAYSAKVDWELDQPVHADLSIAP
jgi:hypothetical protein